MSSNPLLPGDRDYLAAEYVLGLLDGEELALARSLDAEDAAFRTEVARWRGRLAPLLEEVSAATPPATALAAIERRIDDDRPVASNVIELRRGLRRWRAMAGGATAIAASLALVLLTQRPVDSPPASQTAPMIATIDGEAGAAKLVATWDPDRRRLMVIPSIIPAAAQGHSHELWAIGPEGTPKSVGLLPADGPLHASIGEEMARQLAEGVTLAVSVEPAGGSPTGLPTGPVIASGKLRKA